MRAKTAELNDPKANPSGADERDMKQLQSDFTANKAAVLDMLFANIVNVNLEIPKVVKGDFDNEE